MDILVTHLSRRAKGGVSRRIEELSVNTVRFGRNTSLEVYLPDPRVQLDHAVMLLRGAELFVEAVGQADIRVNGRPVRSKLLQTGDVLGVGPYDITILAPPEGKDAAIDVELVRPLGDDFEKLQARSILSLEEYGLSRRLWSWVGAIVTLLVFLIAPIMYFSAHQEQSVKQTAGVRPDSAWNSGPISGSHRFVSDQCNICHQEAFVPVKDEACGACHALTTHHFDAKTDTFSKVGKFVNFSKERCGACHKEHDENGNISITKQEFCIDCHKGLEQTVAGIDTKNAGRFDRDHPEFRPAVVIDSANKVFRRVKLDDKAALVEQSGLKFPHDKHLKKEGVRGPAGKETLQCANCHQLPHGAAGFQPIGMEGMCERCHQLVFDPRRPDRTLPHGQVMNAQLLLREFYSDYALRGGFEEQAPDVAGEAERRRPGSQPEITQGVRINPREWADSQAQKVADQSFGKIMCGKCHEVSTGVGLGPLNWAVVPATVTKTWLKHGRFDHSAHVDMLKCDACHAAEQSKSAADVLLPKIAVCKECHGDANATNQVPSTCLTCHAFHLPGQPLMGARERARADWNGVGILDVTAPAPEGEKN